MFSLAKLPLLIQLRGGSLGHFVLDTEVMIQKLRSLNLPQSVYFVRSKNICNTTLMTLLSQRFTILSHHFLIVRRFLMRLSQEYLENILNIESFSYELVSEAHLQSSPFRPHAKSLENEFEFLMKTFGITQGSRLVTLAIRDSGYDDHYIDKKNQPTFRNTPIDYFENTIQDLISRGYFVFRLGRHNSTRITSLPPSKYFDLSDVDYQQIEKLELAISSISSFMISTGTGLEQLSAIFRKPVLLVNFSPPYVLPSRVYRRVLIPNYERSLFGKSEILKINQMLEIGLFTRNPSSDITSGKLSVKPKKPNEILEFVLESSLLLDKEYAFSGDLDHQVRSLELQGFFVP
jgi:putative glycosyltransferase (TIGR04372 family)